MRETTTYFVSRPKRLFCDHIKLPLFLRPNFFPGRCSQKMTWPLLKKNDLVVASKTDLVVAPKH